MDWVQCDACNKWFHMVCVGLLKVQLKPDEDFVCKICARKEGSEAASGGAVGTRSATAPGATSGGLQGKVKRSITRSL